MHLNRFHLVMAATAALATSASAQIFAQPWQAGKSSSFVSDVKACFSPTPFTRITLDDFGFTVNHNVKFFIWWGTVSSTAQLTKPYDLQIYADAGGVPALSSAGPLWYRCVTPLVTLPVGTDCPGRQVYAFLAFVPGGFNAVAGTKYWLSIDEEEFNSANIGLNDFFWSGTYSFHGAKACQFDVTTGSLIQPLIDNCGALADMSFILI